MPRGRSWVRTNSQPKTPWGMCSPCPELALWWWGVAPPPRWTTMCALLGSSPSSTLNTSAGWKHGLHTMRRRVSHTRSRRDCLWFPYRHHTDTAQPDGQEAGRRQKHLKHSTSATETLYYARCMQRIASRPHLTSDAQQHVMYEPSVMGSVQKPW